MLHFKCPGCKKQLRVDESKAGKGVACPACGAKIRIPDLPEVEPADDESTPRKRPAALRDAGNAPERGYGVREEAQPRPRPRPVEREEPEPKSQEKERPRRKKKRNTTKQEGIFSNMDGFTIALLALGGCWVLFGLLALVVPALCYVLIAVGFLASTAGAIMILIAAFSESAMWGIGCLLCGPVILIFVIMNWTECARPFFLNLAGALVYLTGALLLLFHGMENFM